MFIVRSTRAGIITAHVSAVSDRRL